MTKKYLKNLKKIMNLVNISIDDVSPHPRSSIKVLEKCYDLINEFPDIKFSLFIPISYWRTVKKEIATESPLQIDLFPDFCEYIRKLPPNNFEICYHGFYHGIPNVTDNDEFKNISEFHARERFLGMFEVVKRAKLEKVFKKIFRPPAWRMSPEAIRVSKDLGFEILALSNLDYALKTYGGEDKNFSSVVYADCFPPFEPLKLSKKTEIVYHACEWDKNYLSSVHTNELKSFLNNNRKNIKFSFLKELANG